MKSIVLMGMKHCGKTTLGVMLARRLRLPFIDLDQVVERIEEERLGSPVSAREIYRLRGREAFGELEARGLQEIAGGPARPPRRAVIALGGGTIENAEAMAVLADIGSFLYLEEDEDVLFRRIAAGGLPPFLEGGDPRENFHRLYEKRTALYRRRADAVVSLRGRTPGEGLDAILKVL